MFILKGEIKVVLYVKGLNYNYNLFFFFIKRLSILLYIIFGD